MPAGAGWKRRPAACYGEEEPFFKYHEILATPGFDQPSLLASYGVQGVLGDLGHNGASSICGGQGKSRTRTS